MSKDIVSPFVNNLSVVESNCCLRTLTPLWSVPEMTALLCCCLPLSFYDTRPFINNAQKHFESSSSVTLIGVSGRT